MNLSFAVAASTRQCSHSQVREPRTSWPHFTVSDARLPQSKSQSYLVSSTHLGLTTRFLLLSDSCRFVDVGHSLWQENGSAIYNCCWSLPAQSFLGPSPAGLMTIFYCLIFETPPTWRSRSPYLYPPGTGLPSYTPPQKSQSQIATDGQSVSKSWCRVPSAAHDQIFITLWQLRSCFGGAPSLTRGRVCLLYMMLVVTSVVLLGSESLGTRYYLLLSQIWDFPFRRLLRLTGSRWSYANPPPLRWIPPQFTIDFLCSLHTNTSSKQFFYCCIM
jgi:hypothetical protein